MNGRAALLVMGAMRRLQSMCESLESQGNHAQREGEFRHASELLYFAEVLEGISHDLSLALGKGGEEALDRYMDQITESIHDEAMVHAERRIAEMRQEFKKKLEEEIARRFGSVVKGAPRALQI